VTLPKALAPTQLSPVNAPPPSKQALAIGTTFPGEPGRGGVTHGWRSVPQIPPLSSWSVSLKQVATNRQPRHLAKLCDSRSRSRTRSSKPTRMPIGSPLPDASMPPIHVVAVSVGRFAIGGCYFPVWRSLGRATSVTGWSYASSHGGGAMPGAKISWLPLPTLFKLRGGRPAVVPRVARHRLSCGVDHWRRRRRATGRRQ